MARYEDVEIVDGFSETTVSMLVCDCGHGPIDESEEFCEGCLPEFCQRCAGLSISFGRDVYCSTECFLQDL